MTLTPYIMFNGTCEEALNFYAGALGGQVENLMHFEGTPAEGMTEDKSKVLHAHFRAGELFFMASDGDQNGGNLSSAVHMSLDFKSAEEEQKAFDALAEGGTVTMPLQDTFWGARFGMLTDKFGIPWMFNYDAPKS
ncbi:VOC family protein [Flaviaesturariibacter amylovorans]|uniref:VOC family protein n=1 Tax=Flaviaesturariibacter amylovorans TaxID=1084520 RepID=A0ABP8HAU6_9BACT